MERRDLLEAGFDAGPIIDIAVQTARQLIDQGLPPDEVHRSMRRVADDPDQDFHCEALEKLADIHAQARLFSRDQAGAPWRQWGTDIDPEAIAQMERAVQLPISVYGALMPDAHRGYGLPIGGVLATEEAVIPYAVGMDIACRMKLSVFDLPPQTVDDDRQLLAQALEFQTQFGVGARFDKPQEHPVLDEDWDISPVTKELKHKARHQLGTSGSGNHFAEFGILTLTDEELGLDAGRYLALLTHSGSRGPGAAVAKHYSKLARQRHPELPRQLNALAWLDLASPDGREYWRAMELMGRYASANHEVIHRGVAELLAAPVIGGVENHHNFAWKETYGGRDVVVHRKGATPAGKNVLGVIPGSMTAPAYVVRGRGQVASLNSAAHGAGRVMSRRQAKRSIEWSQVERQLAQNDVKLLSAGLDEAPGVYKDIDAVMDAQRDLVDVIARFSPRVVKMAPDH